MTHCPPVPFIVLVSHFSLYNTCSLENGPEPEGKKDAHVKPADVPVYESATRTAHASSAHLSPSPKHLCLATGHAKEPDNEDVLNGVKVLQFLNVAALVSSAYDHNDYKKCNG